MKSKQTPLNEQITKELFLEYMSVLLNRFNKVDEKLASHTKQLIEIKETLTHHDKMFDAIAVDFVTFNTRFDKIDERFDKIEAILINHDNRFTVIDSAIRDVQSTLLSLKPDTLNDNNRPIGYALRQLIKQR